MLSEQPLIRDGGAEEPDVALLDCGRIEKNGAHHHHLWTNTKEKGNLWRLNPLYFSLL